MRVLIFSTNFRKLPKPFVFPKSWYELKNFEEIYGLKKPFYSYNI